MFDVFSGSHLSKIFLKVSIKTTYRELLLNNFGKVENFSSFGFFRVGVAVGKNQMC